MKNYVVEKKIDYLTFTSHKADNKPFAQYEWQIMKPVNPSYNNAEMHRSGMLHMWHDRRTELGHHYILQGKCLDWIRGNMMSEVELLQRALYHGNISRIDLAVTSHADDWSEHELTPTKIMELCRDGKLISRLKPAKEIAMNGNTETKYIGNPKRRRRLFRAYDKGIDLNLESHKLVRFELETGMNANVIARQVISGNDIGSIIKRYVDFDNEVWLNIIGSEHSVIKHDTGEVEMDAFERDRLARAAKWNWLQDSIAPMIGKLLAENNNLDCITQYENEYWHEFIREVGKHTRTS